MPEGYIPVPEGYIPVPGGYITSHQPIRDKTPTINPYGVLISRREEEKKEREIMPSLMAT